MLILIFCIDCYITSTKCNGSSCAFRYWIPNKDNIVTFEELFQILEDCGKDLNAIAGFSGDEPVLTRLCTASIRYWIPNKDNIIPVQHLLYLVVNYA